MAMYETQEAKSLIPEDIRPVLWFMLQELNDPSPHHCFELTMANSDNESRQHIIHTQKNTKYHREFSFKCTAPITMSVYIIGFGNDDWLMLMRP